MSHVLILTAHSGGGHVSLAEALRERLPADATATTIDPLPPSANLHYRMVSRHALGLWAAEFRTTNAPALARLMNNTMSLLIGRKLRTVLAQQQPDLVLSTCAVLNNAMLAAIAQEQPGTPFAVLIADAKGLHATWLTARNASATFAPTRESYREALDAGLPEARVQLTGWPVRAQFMQRYDQQAEREKLGLHADRFTVFVQGGGEGTAQIADTVAHVLASGAAQVILAAGTNRALQERFRGAAGVRVLSFTPEIAPLMAAADVVIGKAGPNALFESVTLGLPFIATTFIPGQETGNLALIERYGLGWLALQAERQRSLLLTLAHYPSERAAMAASVGRYRDWNMGAVAGLAPLLQELCAAGQQRPAGHPRLRPARWARRRAA